MNKKGQALVESVVAISVLMVGFMAILTLLNQSLGMSRVISEKNVATYLASEGIEAVKNRIDSNILSSSTVPSWADGLSNGSKYDVAYDLTTGISQLTPASGYPLCFSKGNQHLYYSTSDGLCNQSVESIPTKYIRHIDISLNGDELKAVSSVTWTTRGNDSESISLEDHFYNWRP